MSSVITSSALTKDDEANLNVNSIFVEELNANDGDPIRLDNLSVSDTVQHLKRATAEKIGQPSQWNDLTFIFIEEELTRCKTEGFCAKYKANRLDSGQYVVLLWHCRCKRHVPTRLVRKTEADYRTRATVFSSLVPSVRKSAAHRLRASLRHTQPAQNPLSTTFSSKVQVLRLII
jgi:hypothetical protein